MPVDVSWLDSLCGNDPCLVVDDLDAGYGQMQVIRKVNLRVGRGQSLCLIGPNGAGKSTVLHAIFGLNTLFSGRIAMRGDGAWKEVTHLTPESKLATAGIAYILQDSSIFPDMSVEENLWLGGYLLTSRAEARREAERIFDTYPRLAARRRQSAGDLSGGERRLLEISRALMMNPQLLLIDEPSIGLEPRFIETVFEILHQLQHDEGRTIILVEQNVQKGLEFADIGYVMVAGNIVIADRCDKLIENADVAKLFLSG